MTKESKEITINGVEYIRKDMLRTPAEERDGMPYVIVRSPSVGVFAGYLESREGREVVIREARRIWYWDGAATLSQLAVDGTKAPENCKFPCAVNRVEVLDVGEILYCTERARRSIQAVPVWER
ncbi:MAG: hypothetical protein JRD89_02870 [Deltaproteobacteria bacterium]|nr:hypothetical protein [Deltaproteobacteria bacterium]